MGNIDEFIEGLGSHHAIPVSGPNEALEVYRARQAEIHAGRDPGTYASAAARYWRLFAQPTSEGHLRCLVCHRVCTRPLPHTPPHKDDCVIGQKLLEAYGSWDKLWEAVRHL